MRLRTQPKVAVASALSVFALYGGWQSLTPDCGPNTGKSFREEFTHMTSTSEYCGESRFNCEVRLPHWQKPIVVAVYSEEIEASAVDLIRSITFRALAEISEVSSIGVVDDPQLETNVLVFIMNDQMANRLSQPDAASVRFQPGSINRRAYDDQSCSGQFWASSLAEIDENQHQTILGGVIFVHHSLKNMNLESCIYEEIAGVVGLSNDPKGQPSLFSGGNYEVVDGQFKYSARTLLMFEAIYQIASGAFADIDGFCNSQY